MARKNGLDYRGMAANRRVSESRASDRATAFQASSVTVAYRQQETWKDDVATTKKILEHAEFMLLSENSRVWYAHQLKWLEANPNKCCRPDLRINTANTLKTLQRIAVKRKMGLLPVAQLTATPLPAAPPAASPAAVDSVSSESSKSLDPAEPAERPAGSVSSDSPPKARRKPPRVSSEVLNRQRIHHYHEQNVSAMREGSPWLLDARLLPKTPPSRAQAVERDDERPRAELLPDPKDGTR